MTLSFCFCVLALLYFTQMYRSKLSRHLLAWGWHSSLSRPLDLNVLQVLHVVFENSWYIPNLFVNWDRILSLFLSLVSLELKGKVLFSKRRILHWFKRKGKRKAGLHSCLSKICLKIWGRIFKKWWTAWVLFCRTAASEHPCLLLCPQCQKAIINQKYVHPWRQFLVYDP